ncbi:PEP-utilizing enzyme [Streptomyces nodosus]|uniref:PEP-utilizing protein mobile subunit n=1 Tax=Streptomyces nodosus TaxID=40318 RepID=A0A0B5DGI0_9ACTN|nr:PEP-utilizing enzyme [Streptomyces nodosus]AJE42314.1 PEP-utilizing protein mobile subunit [Streptomyces nodosus]MBB4793599.1 pyruvate,water dikinase [Streptomyces nodosus]QEV40829.1 PEP-utilizing protein mobile subunit [Streptomyces nodosus]
MSLVIPVDEYATDEWYPGFTPAFGHAPFVVEPFRTFSEQDEKRFWFLDFHCPRGLTPLGTTWLEDCYSWGTQLTAEQMPLPHSRGITQRMAGTHVYAAAIPVESRYEIEARSVRMERRLPGFLQGFQALWNRRVAEIDAGWRYFQGIDVERSSLSELGAMLAEARRYAQRAFEIHFEMMYPLLANHLGFTGMCTELGLDPHEVGTFLQGHDTKIMETDRELGRLAAAARDAGLGPLFAATEPERLAGTLAAEGGAATAWTSRLRDFLDVYGHRIEGVCDVALPSWIEDPAPVLGMVRTLLLKDTDHDFEAALRQAQIERDTAIDAARSRLTRREQEAFDAGLASVQAANFLRWQDDHSHYIDLRVSLPMRRAALGIAEKAGADRPDDTLFLFWPELDAVASGERAYGEFRSIVEVRRQYFAHWHERRASMPKVLGTVPEAVEDPILTEIFGLDEHFLRVVTATARAGDGTTLTGVPAAKGRATGVARVLSDAGDLHRLRPGEVLVCESTSPHWTPAFAAIAACVCDSGGMLSHAAIVGREYGVPTVTACGLATVLVEDGDRVEVDGGRGTVTVVRVGAPAGGSGS